MSATALAHCPSGVVIDHHRDEPLLAHDRDRHAALLARPGGFCGQSAAVTALAVGASRAVLRTSPMPYCAATAPRAVVPGRPGRAVPFTLGWNVTVSVGDEDGTLIVARRHESLSAGGRWHVSANEGAEPHDLPDAGRVDVTAVTARALHEELGVDVSWDELAPVTTAHSVFVVDGTAALGVAIHVTLGALGWTVDDVRASHRGAVDGWEASALAAVPARTDAVAAFAADGGWTPWAPVCFRGALSVLEHRRAASAA